MVKAKLLKSLEKRIRNDDGRCEQCGSDDLDESGCWCNECGCWTYGDFPKDLTKK